MFNSINDFTNPILCCVLYIGWEVSLNLGIIKTSVLVFILAVAYIIARGFGKYTGARVGAKITDAEPAVQKYLGFALLPQGGVSLGLLVVVSRQMPTFYPLISTIIMVSIFNL